MVKVQIPTFQLMFSLPNLTLTVVTFFFDFKKIKSIVRSWLLVGAFSTAHHAELCIHTWGMHDLHSMTSQKVTRMQLTLVYSQFYMSFRLHRQFIYNLANIFKLKPHPLSLILIFRCYHSRRSTHRVVNA